MTAVVYVLAGELWPAEMSLIKIIASVLADIVEIVADTGDLGTHFG